MATYGWGLVSRLTPHPADTPAGAQLGLEKYEGPTFTQELLSPQIKGLELIDFILIRSESERHRSRGGGGPTETTLTSTKASKRAPEFRKETKTNSAHGFRRPKAVSARGKCPKGHYWSYKKKKCVKSKF